jgi:hypothetical protein
MGCNIDQSVVPVAMSLLRLIMLRRILGFYDLFVSIDQSIREGRLHTRHCDWSAESLVRRRLSVNSGGYFPSLLWESLTLIGILLSRAQSLRLAWPGVPRVPR